RGQQPGIVERRWLRWLRADQRRQQQSALRTELEFWLPARNQVECPARSLVHRQERNAPLLRQCRQSQSPGAGDRALYQCPNCGPEHLRDQPVHRSHPVECVAVAQSQQSAARQSECPEATTSYGPPAVLWIRGRRTSDRQLDLSGCAASSGETFLEWIGVPR